LEGTGTVGSALIGCVGAKVVVGTTAGGVVKSGMALGGVPGGELVRSSFFGLCVCCLGFLPTMGACDAARDSDCTKSPEIAGYSSDTKADEGL
jgi:hypothetical protein